MINRSSIYSILVAQAVPIFSAHSEVLARQTEDSADLLAPAITAGSTQSNREEDNGPERRTCPYVSMCRRKAIIEDNAADVA